MTNYDLLLRKAGSYLQTMGKTIKASSAVQKSFGVGVDISLCLEQQIFVGYIIGQSGDNITFTNIFEGVSVFHLYHQTFASLVYADKISSGVGVYIVGFIVNWE